MSNTKPQIFIPGTRGFIRWHLVRQARLAAAYTPLLGEADAIIYARGPGDPRRVDSVGPHLAEFEQDLLEFERVRGPSIFQRTLVLSSLDVQSNVSPYTSLCLAKEALALARGCRVVRTCCVFGPFMQESKFIFQMLSRLSKRELVTIHKDALRSWTYVEDLARHLVGNAQRLPFAINEGDDPLSTYTSYTASPLHMATVAAEHFGWPLLVEEYDFHSSRPDHTRKVTGRTAPGSLGLSQAPEHLAFTAEWMGVLP
jgi:hypothetical protein